MKILKVSFDHRVVKIIGNHVSLDMKVEQQSICLGSPESLHDQWGGDLFMEPFIWWYCNNTFVSVTTKWSEKDWEAEGCVLTIEPLSLVY